METQPTPIPSARAASQKRVNGRHNGISDGLRHGAPPNLRALFRIRLCKYGQLHGRLIETFQLESSITRRSVSAVGRESLGVRRSEILTNALAFCRVIHKNKTPGLAQPDRRSKARKPKKAVDASRRQRIATKLPDIPPPKHKVRQLRAKARIEVWNGARRFFAAHGRVTAPDAAKMA